MPSLANVLARFTKQTMLYWRKTGSDTYGKPTYVSPAILSIRWEDKQQEIITTDGRKVLSKGYILLGTPLAVGSLVFLGLMTDWLAMPTYPAIPTVNQGGREVILVKTTPDIKAQSYIYEAYL